MLHRGSLLRLLNGARPHTRPENAPIPQRDAELNEAISGVHLEVD